MSDLIIKEVRTKKELKDFIYLPELVHKGDKKWLPPLYADEWNLFNPRKNKSFRHADTIMYVAYRNGKPAGRIMGIIHRLYNRIHNEKHARFAFIESCNDRETVQMLLSKTEEWARGHGMKIMTGPLGFSDKDPQGLIVKGFEYPHFFTSPTNDPYLPELVAGEGYVKKVDLVNYIMPMPGKLPEVYDRMLERFRKNNSFNVVEFETKKQLKSFILPVLEVMNQTYLEIYGYYPLDDEEKEDLASRYLPVLDPHYIKVVTCGTEVVAFAVAMADPSEGIRKARGRLLPTGIFHILREIRRTDTILTMLGGIKKEYREQGLDVLMAVKLYESAIKAGMKIINSHLILETNTRMRGEFERIGGSVSKVFRIFQKEIQ